MRKSVLPALVDSSKHMMVPSEISVRYSPAALQPSLTNAGVSSTNILVSNLFLKTTEKMNWSKVSEQRVYLNALAIFRTVESRTNGNESNDRGDECSKRVETNCFPSNAGGPSKRHHVYYRNQDVDKD